MIGRPGLRVALALPAVPDGWCVEQVNIYKQRATWDSATGLVSFEDNDLQSGYASVETQTTWVKVAELDADVRTWVDEGQFLGEILITQDYFPPADTLTVKGETAAGCLVGFTDNQLWFSERNAYHAWPLKARHVFDSTILNICVLQNSVFVFTCRKVWRVDDDATCEDASARSALDLKTKPLISEHPDGCITTPAGVLYVVSDGLYLLGSESNRRVSDKAFDKVTWEALDPSTIALGFGCDHVFMMTQAGTYAWVFSLDEFSQMPEDVTTLSFTPEQMLTDDKGELYLLSHNGLWLFNALDYMYYEWVQNTQRSDERIRLSSVSAQYLKKTTPEHNRLKLLVDETPYWFRPLREGFSRIRSLRTDCFAFSVKGQEPLCRFSYGAGALDND